MSSREDISVSLYRLFLYLHENKSKFNSDRKKFTEQRLELGEGRAAENPKKSSSPDFIGCSGSTFCLLWFSRPWPGFCFEIKFFSKKFSGGGSGGNVFDLESKGTGSNPAVKVTATEVVKFWTAGPKDLSSNSA